MKFIGLIAFLFLFSACKSIPEPSSPPVIPLPHSDFIFMGDTGTGDEGQYKVAQGVQSFCESALNECEFGLLLGDNIYSFGVKSISDSQWYEKFEKPYAGLDFKFYAALGNHDHYGKWEPQVEYKSAHWSMPARYYRLSTEHAEIFVLDTEKMTDTQADWLDTVLPYSSDKWVVVVGHHPIYSYGAHGDTDNLKKDILPILIRRNVDFYLSGHDHDLQIIERDGIIFVVSGAGAKLRDTGYGDYTLWNKSSLGFSHMDLEKNSATLRMLGVNGDLLFKKTYLK